ncbi:MAG TPA: serine/threonine-protein kinase [Longimicrobiales bacterium]|nr:serine/threonine-protein kinase [Longimicrobiales bacterium]
MAQSGAGNVSGAITTARWERVHEALQATLDLDPPARATHLAAIGRTDPALREEVESLLSSMTGTGRFDALVRQFVAVNGHEQVPERIGAWRPIRLLARGGMGAVYLAERADGAYDQRVAIKLLPAGTRADLHSRFIAERRILARLSHPNIARLIDGGTTGDGLPFLVLEYVEGEPLTTWCDRKALSLESRLRLFLDVCAAVSWAHANLIVHRDIKPANVLVEAAGGDDPRVKLLDFGIAKLLDDEPFDGAPATRADLRLLTPDYAAPEQVRGEAATTATDVYQLGVVLYELLSGRRPHRFASRTLDAIEREICGKDPVRPGVAFDQSPDDRAPDGSAIANARSTTPKRLAKSLAGDLDTIVMHALAKEKERRYASVEALAADVRRYLDGRPVQARPDSLAYRAGKFVRRNRAAVLAGTAITSLLIVLVASTIVQNGRIQAERDRAERAAGFLADLFEDLEPAQARGSMVDPREMLDRATERVSIEMEDDPLLQAELFDVLGSVYQMRGFFAEAETLLRNGLALRERVLPPDHEDVAASRYTLAYLLGDTDRWAQAEPLLAQAVAVLRDRFGDAHGRVAVIEVWQALARLDAGDLPAADSILTAAIEKLRSPDGDPFELTTALLYAGRIRIARGDPYAAAQPMREALDIRIGLFGRQHPTVANALDGIGEVKQALGDWSGAEATYRDALAIRRTLFPPDHADIGASYHNLGIALHGQGRNAEAAVMLDSAFAVLEPAFGADHSLVRVTLAYRDSVGN